MNTIYKYKINSGLNSINLPVGSKVLCVQAQHDVPYIWVQVKDDVELEERHFKFYGTGHNIHNDKKNYIGTFQSARGAFVFHLYEIEPK